MATALKARSKTRAIPDYESLEYWNGIIKMSLSKFFVLCVLQRGPAHGYEIARQVADCTNGSCSPTEGAIYPVLKEFLAGKYVTTKTQIVKGRTRKVYTVTKKGRRAFLVAAAAWREVGDRVDEVVSEVSGA